MVVKEASEKCFNDRKEDRETNSDENSGATERDSEHRNGTENRNGVMSERLINGSQNEDSSDDEPEPVDLLR